MTWDVIVVGAGAAGLATAIFTRNRRPEASVLLLDGARKPGAKILVSGGGRCNVTNTVVTERDYRGGPPAIVRRVLRALTVADTVRFFADAGVALHEEHDGKLFPDSNSARQVLDALLEQAAASGVELRSSHRVSRLEKTAGGFRVATNAGELLARRVVLATGGMSLPKSGSDGAGYALARALGHTIVATTPALAPLVLSASGEDAPATHSTWSGVSQPVILTLRADGSVATRQPGSMLWTHFGISGPAALDLSRHWLRARLEGRAAEATANLTPDFHFESLEDFWLDQARHRPRAMLGTILAHPGSRGGCRGGARGARHRRVDDTRLAHARRSTPSLSCTDGMAHSDCRLARLQLRRGHGGWRRPARDRSVDDGVEVLSGALSGRRDAGRRRPPWRVQLSVGLVERGCRGGRD